MNQPARAKTRSTMSLLLLLMFVLLPPMAGTGMALAAADAAPPPTTTNAASDTATAATDDLAATVARMAKIGSAFSPSFSSDGKTLAFVTDLTGVPQVWTVSSDGGWPQRVTSLDDHVDSVTWAPQGDWLAFSLAPGGGMNQQVYLIRPDGTGLQRLTAGGKDNNWIGDWSPDGKWLTIASNKDDPRAMDAFIWERGRDGLRRIAKNTGIGQLNDVSDDGARAVLYRMKSRSDSNLYLIDIASGGEALLTPHEPPGTFNGGIFSPDGRTVYLISNKDSDRAVLAQVKIDEKGKPGPIERLLARDDAELQAIDLTADGSTAALLWNAAGRSELDFFDVKTRRVTHAPALPAEIAGGIVFSRDGKRLAVTLSGAAAPVDIWVLERATGKLTQVTHSQHPGVQLDEMIKPELVRFKAHDGLDLSGWLYRPKGAQGPGPIVLSFHGGPEGQARPSFSSTTQALLARGIAVFSPNVRGSSGFGKKFVNLDNGALRVDGVKDITACVDKVVAMKVADPKRIGIMGGSYGGYMVMAGLTEFPDTFAAGANLFGVVNFETFFANTEPWMAAISTVEYGDPNTEADMLRRLSPIHKVDRVKAPTIVLHGANDTNVPVVEAEQVVESLKKRGVPVEYILFPDEGHGWDKEINKVRSTVAIVQWFERYLKG